METNFKFCLPGQDRSYVGDNAKTGFHMRFYHDLKISCLSMKFGALQI